MIDAHACAAALATSRKESKYWVLANSRVFQPVALETLRAMDYSSLTFLSTQGRCLTDTSVSDVIVQRFNCVLVLRSFINANEDPDL